MSDILENQSRNELAGFPDMRLGTPAGFLADRDLQTARMTRFLEFSGAEVLLADEAARGAYIDRLTPDGFNELLITVNGILLNIPRERREYITSTNYSTDEETGGVRWVHPDPDDKRSLLGDVLITAQRQKALEEKALTLAVGISSVHPFWEGSGRVSRLAYHLLRKGFRADDPLVPQLLGPDGDAHLSPNSSSVEAVLIGELERDVYRSHVQIDDEGYFTAARVLTAGNKSGPFVVGRLPENPNLTLDEMSTMLGIFSEFHLRTIIPWLALSNGYGGIAQHIYRVDNLPKGTDYAFDYNTFSASMTSGDALLVRGLARIVKQDYIDRLLQALADPRFLTPIPLPSGELVKRPISEVLYLTTNHLIEFGTTKKAPRL